MSILNTLKSWMGLALKPAPQPDEPDTHKTVTLPNGRVAVVDVQGNFVRFIS
jgi:hypothetical protein